MEYKEEKTPNQNGKKKKRFQKKEDSIKSFWENFMHANIHTMGVPGEDRQQEMENLLKKKMMENFPNLIKGIHIQVQMHRG